MTSIPRHRIAALATAAMLTAGALAALAPSAQAAQTGRQLRNGPIVVENDAEYLYTINQDGTSPVQRLREASAPAWSPDGRRLAYVNESTGRVNVARSDFTDPVELPVDTTNTVQTQAPTFWAGNATVVYVNGHTLYSAPADGSQTGTALYPAGTGGCDSQPSGAANGLLVFIHRSACGEDAPIVTPELWELHAATGQAHKVTEHGAFPALSPDGSKIAYTWQNTVHVMNTDGTEDTTIPLDTSRSYYGASWSPRGDKLVYEVAPDSEGDDRELGIVTLATGETMTIADHTVFFNPAWQPVRK